MKIVQSEILIGRDRICAFLGGDGPPVSKSVFYQLVKAGLPVKKQCAVGEKKSRWIGHKDVLNSYVRKMVEED